MDEKSDKRAASREVQKRVAEDEKILLMLTQFDDFLSLAEKDRLLEAAAAEPVLPADAFDLPTGDAAWD